VQNELLTEDERKALEGFSLPALDQVPHSGPRASTHPPDA
jgi:hypothetical protein